MTTKESEIRNMIDCFHDMPQQDVDSMIELLDHGEWGVAFEILCSTLVQEKIPIDTAMFRKIEHIGRQMNFEEILWSGMIVQE